MKRGLHYQISCQERTVCFSRDLAAPLRQAGLAARLTSSRQLADF